MANETKITGITIAGMILMAVFSFTQLIPEVRLSGGSVFAGIAAFFILELIEKPEMSNLRFKGLKKDLKKTGWLLLILPVITEFMNVIPGELIFHGTYAAHSIGRASQYLVAKDIVVFLVSLPVYAWGEEIAWRGFFLGKAMNRVPFMAAAVVSSALFAMGHISDADTGMVLYEIGWVFIDSLIFSITFWKSENCMVTTITHLVGNIAGFALYFALI